MIQEVLAPRQDQLQGVPPVRWAHRPFEFEMRWPADPPGARAADAERLAAMMRPTPGRVCAILDPEPDASRGGVLLPVTDRFHEFDGDFVDAFRPSSATLVDDGAAGIPARPGDRLIVRPYHGVVFDHLFGVDDVMFIGSRRYEWWRDVVAVETADGVGICGDWVVCGRPEIGERAGLVLPGHSGLDDAVVFVVDAGPLARCSMGSPVDPGWYAWSRYREQWRRDDAQFYACYDSPWGDVLIMRASGERLNREAQRPVPHARLVRIDA